MARKAAARASSDAGSFRGLVRQLIESRGYVKAAQVKEALAATDPKLYSTLRPSQETTIYQVLKDMGYGRTGKASRKTGPSAQPATAAQGLAALFESADPEQLRRQLNELKERKQKLERAIRALELLLGDTDRHGLARRMRRASVIVPRQIRSARRGEAPASATDF